MDVPPFLDDDVWVQEVDGLDLDQGEVLLAVLGSPDDARDGVACPQLELPDLGGRDIDVVLAGQVAELRGPQEAEAVLEALQDALRKEQSLLLGLGLQDLEDQVVLARVLDLVVRQAHRRSDLLQAGDVLLLEVDQIELLEGRFDVVVSFRHHLWFFSQGELAIGLFSNKTFFSWSGAVPWPLRPPPSGPVAPPRRRAPSCPGFRPASSAVPGSGRP